jgi:CRISPR-associated exonuclease Cas4
MPSGEVFYQDLPGQPFVARDLRSVVLGISGKPDCLIRTIDGVVPVELKHSNRPPARGGVYPNHMIQNLAYCVLVEEQLREKVPYGLVIYGGQQVRRIELTDANREWLMCTVAALRAARLAKQAKRNHNQCRRCSGCGVRAHCDQALL